MSSHQGFDDAQFRGTPQAIQRLIPTEVKKPLPGRAPVLIYVLNPVKAGISAFADLKTFVINLKGGLKASLETADKPYFVQISGKNGAGVGATN